MTFAGVKSVLQHKIRFFTKPVIAAKKCILLPFKCTMPKPRLKITAAFIASFFTVQSFSQSVSINTSAAVADSSAMLDVSSTTKGLLIPRMTNLQKNTIPAPATGLLIYQEDGDTGFYYYNGTNWYLLVTTAVNTDKQNTLIYTIKGF